VRLRPSCSLIACCAEMVDSALDRVSGLVTRISVRVEAQAGPQAVVGTAVQCIAIDTVGLRKVAIVCTPASADVSAASPRMRAMNIRVCGLCDTCVIEPAADCIASGDAVAARGQLTRTCAIALAILEVLVLRVCRAFCAAGVLNRSTIDIARWAVLYADRPAKQASVWAVNGRIK